MNFRKGRWRLALGRLVNLRYINRWVIFVRMFLIGVRWSCSPAHTKVNIL